MADVPIAALDVQKLGWLADAPLFIDTEQVAAFYDAVVRPEAEQKKITLSLKSLESQKTTLGGEAKATVSVAKWLTTIFPFLDASVEGTLQGATENQGGTEKTREIELHPINSPQRQLVQLTLHYVLNLPGRIRIVSDPADPYWYDDVFIRTLPRGLVFVDFPAKSAFVPMAAELDNGKVVLMYDEVAKAFTGGKDNPNPRPKRGSLAAAEEEAAWLKYWRWYADHFDSWEAMNAVETVVGDGGRIRWIDYRVPLLKNGKTLHLHVAGRGAYDTGVFAYNLIQRGFLHGFRLVGTLKSDPDVNVLAIFDK